MTNHTFHRAGIDELTARRLHDILQLRSDIFVVEQRCVFLEIDGRDTEPAVVHWWASPEHDPSRVVATLRVLPAEDGPTELGRIVAHRSVRGTGLAHELLDAALATCIGSVTIKAQSPLAPWYAQHGFVVSGPEFDEDGIAHVPMSLS